MSYAVLVYPSFERVFDSFLDYYLDISPDLAERFNDEVKAEVLALDHMPYRYKSSSFNDEIRVKKLPHFPYLIFFAVEENCVHVFNIVHAKQDPDTIAKTVNIPK